MDPLSEEQQKNFIAKLYKKGQLVRHASLKNERGTGLVCKVQWSKARKCVMIEVYWQKAQKKEWHKVWHITRVN